MASPVFAAQEAEEEDVAPHVVVAVRLRPLSEKELLESSQKIVKANGNKLVFSDKDQEYLYNFDHVLGDAADQAAVFDCLGKPQVEKAFDGYNSTIFAYGQTGSGKTFTMLNVQGSKKDMGLIPRISEALFARLAEAQRSSTTSRFLVQCSFLEIYNEVIYDLLVPRSKDSRGKGLEIREQKGLGVYVKDLTEEVVAEVEQLDRLLHAGFSQRTTSATAMNDASSRSHCVFTICLHYQDTSDSSRNTISKLHLVDLAGSEKTGSDERKHLKENANINKSLSALGNVINALSSASSVAGGVRRNAFVPYRDSKLTRVLQESLGGNAFCTMIATISPAAVNSEETWSTLQYAKRAKTIRVAATRNKESQQREELQREVDELRKFAQEASSTEELEARHKSEIEALEAFMKQTWEDKQRLSKEHEEQRELARQEVQRANEERQAEQRRRIEALEKLGDLNVTLQSFVALGQAGHVSWPQRLASVLRLPQQLLAQQQAVRLYREGAAAEVKELLEKASEDPIASSLLLNQAAAKLKLLATTLTALEEAERDYKGQLCALSTEIAITLAELRAEAKGETESLALLQLVQRQLGEHYSSISEQLLKEVTSLGFDLVGRDRMGLQSAPGLAEVLSSLRALPEVLSGEPLPTALGLASSEFPDEGLMGSSNGELAACARLQQSRWTAGWCPATSSKEEFLEVDVQRAPHVGRICGIALQGRLPASGHWQQTLGLLQLALGADEEALAFAQPQTFLRPPVRCVHQVAWALHKKRSFKKWQPSEQVRDYENLTKEAKLDFLSRLIEEAHTVKGPVVAGLSDSEDEDVEPLRLTAQDILAGRNCAETNRLLQLLASRALGYGEAPSWTSRWRLQYLVDDDWQWHDESFEGNSSATEVRVVQLPRPLHARKLRIYPLEWRQRPALRLELFVIQDAASPGASEVFRELQAHVTLVLSALDEVKKHVEVGMRQNALAKEQQVQEQSQLQTQLQEALAKAALSEAHLLELKAEKKRLEVLSKSQGKEIDRLSRQSSNHREECEKVQAALEDLQEQLAIICDERDLARSHELEFFYVLNRKDVELVEARKALADLTQHVKVTAPGHGGPVRALRERRFRRRDRAMPELCDIHTLACTQLFPFALKFCSGSALSMLRAAGPIFSEAIPESSPLWKELLQESSAWLHDSKTSLMHKAHRLSVAAERCRFDREDGSLQVPHPTPVNKSRRYRLIVTGARRSGISTLVRIMAGREELDNQGKDMSLVNFSADLDGQVLSISAVDKRSTAIVTPLSAALYNGHSAALFVFDAANADSLKTTACCIAELQQTVGPQKFRRMPKLLVCHKADVLPKVEDRLAELPAMCEALLSTYGMDLVFTTREDPSSIHLAVALAAEHWPEADPDDASRKFPAISRQQLRPTRTVVRRNTVVNLPPRRPANILEELRSRVPRIE